MSLLNAGQVFTTTIPVSGIVTIDLSTIADPTDIFHVDISGGGTLRGFFITDNGVDPLDPGNTSRYTTFTMSAPISADPAEVFTVVHMDPGVPAGQRIFCPGFRDDTIVDEHDHFCRFTWLADGESGEWVIKDNTWVAAP